MFPKDPRPEAEAIRVRLVKLQTHVPSGHIVWYSDWKLYQVNKNSPLGQHYYIADLSVPCRSNLYKFLTGLLLNWNWNFEGDVDVTEEQARVLKRVFESQKEYSFWKRGLDILIKSGKEEAWKWLAEDTPLLVLKKELSK